MTRSLLLLACLVTLSITTTAADPATAIGKRAITFTLEDQYEQEWAWDKHWRGKPTIVMMTDRNGKDYLQNWIKPLVDSLDSKVRFASFADVSTVPGFLKGFIRSRFREAFTWSILMDWDGVVIEHYLARPDVPNLLFVDASGTVRLQGTGTSVKTFIDQVKRFLQP
jgi:hypothetical protein